jgi:hypothetical protein
MKKLNIVDINSLEPTKINNLKEKAKRGFQMLRFPRAGSTAIKYAFSKSVPDNLFTDLECSSFSSPPFSWGFEHNAALNFPVDCPPTHPVYDRILEVIVGAGGNYEGSNRDFNKSDGKDWVRDFNTRADKKPEYDSNKLTFQVVRNPYDWITSIYTWDFMKTRKFKCINDFDKFILFCFNESLIYHGERGTSTWSRNVQHPFPWPMMKRCFFQGFDDSDNCHVDVYIRYEQLNDGIRSLMALADHELSIDLNKPQPPMVPNNNCSPTYDAVMKTKVTKWSQKNQFSDYSKHFYKSDRIKQLVKNAYAWDLENFSYDFNGQKNDSAVLVNIR